MSTFRFTPRIDDFGRHGELRPNFLFWLAMLVLTRHTWFSVGALAAAGKVRESAVLLADFSWVSIAVELPALAVAVLAFNRKPAAGALVRRLWRHARWLLLAAGIGQALFTAWQFGTAHAASDFWRGIDIAVLAATLAAIGWIFKSRYVAALFADFPAAIQPARSPEHGAVVPAAKAPAPLSTAAGAIGPVQPHAVKRSAETLAQIEHAIGFFRQNRYAEAEAICRQLLERDPDDPDGLHLFGCMRLCQGDAQAAIQWIACAIAVSPSVADYHANLGIAYGELGRTADAERCARAAAELDAAAQAGRSPAPAR